LLLASGGKTQTGQALQNMSNGIGACSNVLHTKLNPITNHGGSEAGSYLRLIDSCITPLKAQGPARTCHESKEEEEEAPAWWLSTSRALQFKNNYFTAMCSGSEAGSYLRIIDFYITQL